MHHTPVRSIMTPNPVTVGVDDDVSDVRGLLRQASFHHVVVVDNGDVVGIVSTYDLARLSLDAWVPNPRTVDAELDQSFDLAGVMTPAPITVDVEDTLQDVAAHFADGSLHALPVLDDDVLVGIVTTTDLARCLAEA